MSLNKFEIFKKVGLGPNNLQYCFGGKYIRTENIGLQVNFWKSTGTYMCFPGESAVKNPPAVFEMQAPTLGQEDPLEKEMATHSNIRAWEIQWAEELCGLQSMGARRVGHNLTTNPPPPHKCTSATPALWLCGGKSSRMG